MITLDSFISWKIFEVFKDSSDDTADRANHRFTVGLLLFFAGLIGGSQTFGNPMQCLIPQEYPKGWADYINSYCFITNTYLPKGFEPEEMHNDILKQNEKINIGYYQWIPYILLIQSLFFVIPHLLWNFSQSFSDVDYNLFVQRCIKVRNLADDGRAILDQVATDICEILHYRKIKKRSGSGLGNIGVFFYCFSKLLYIINLITQLICLSFLVGKNRSDWGLDLLQNSFCFKNGYYIEYRQNTSNQYFPPLAFCDFKENKLANVQEKTVQCLLMLNILNEKIFVLIYVWFYLLLLLTVTNFVYTIIRLVSSVGIYQSHSFLQIHGVDERTSIKFLSDKLGLDGLLLLYFIKNSASFTIASDLACIIYDTEYSHLLNNNIRNSYPKTLTDSENSSFLTKKPALNY